MRSSEELAAEKAFYLERAKVDDEAGEREEHEVLIRDCLELTTSAMNRPRAICVLADSCIHWESGGPQFYASSDGKETHFRATVRGALVALRRELLDARHKELLGSLERHQEAAARLSRFNDRWAKVKP